jgi:sulfur carrier protein ThiS
LVHNTLKISHNVVVPKSQHAKAALRHMGIALFVCLRAFCKVVLTAINFNDEPRRIAREVNDELVDRNLAAKMKAERFQLAKLAPQSSFSVCLIGA